MLPLAGLILCLAMVRVLLYALAAKSVGGLATALCQYDCGWYTNLAEYGYPSLPLPATDEVNWAFFPLFPALIRFAKEVSGWPYPAASILVNIALFPLTVLLGCIWYRRTRPAETAEGDGLGQLAVLFFCFPYSLYYAVPYTETLFATLMLAVLMLVRAERWIAAGFVAALLTATRSTGALVVMVIAVATAASILPQLWARDRGARHKTLNRLLGVLCFAALGGLGISVYGLYLHAHVGDALAFQHVQAAWNREIGNPFEVLARGYYANDLRGLFLSNPDHAWSDRYLAIVTTLGLLLCLFLFASRRWLEGAISTVLILVPLSTQLVSMPRYAFGNPLMILAVWDLCRRLGVAGRMMVVACAATLQAFLVFNWLRRALFLV